MFISKEFRSAWIEWKQHKSEKGNPYTPTAETMALSVLFKQSHGIEDLAIQSINYSIENNWNKIYIVKDYNNGAGQTNTNNGKSNFRDSVKDELDKRYGNREQAAN